jgi:hypothetical protein
MSSNVVSANITYLALDANNDPDFNAGNSLTGVNAVAQAILTRLNLFLGEWWENLNLGLPVFQKMLGQLASRKGLAAMTALVQQNVAGTPYVVQPVTVVTTFNNGALTFQVTANTIFGQVNVQYQPGVSAGVGA